MQEIKMEIEGTPIGLIVTEFRDNGDVLLLNYDSFEEVINRIAYLLNKVFGFDNEGNFNFSDNKLVVSIGRPKCLNT